MVASWVSFWAMFWKEEGKRRWVWGGRSIALECGGRKKAKREMGGGGGDTVAGKCLLRLGLELTSCFRRMVLMMTASRTPVAILRISSCQTKEHRELMMLVDHCVLGFCDVRLYEGRNTSSTKTGKP